MSDSDYTRDERQRGRETVDAAVWRIDPIREEDDEAAAAREEPASPKPGTPDWNAAHFNNMYGNAKERFKKGDYATAQVMFERCANMPEGFNVLKTHEYIKSCEELLDNEIKEEIEKKYSLAKEKQEQIAKAASSKKGKKDGLMNCAGCISNQGGYKKLTGGHFKKSNKKRKTIKRKSIKRKSIKRKSTRIRKLSRKKLSRRR